MFTIYFNGKWSNSYQFSVTYIEILLKKYYNNGPLNAWHYDHFFFVLNVQSLAKTTFDIRIYYIILYYIYI